MATIQLTSKEHAFIQGLMPLAVAVIDEPVTEAEALRIILERGFQAAVSDIITPAGEATNTAALLQLAALYPREVASFIADRVALGDDLNRRNRPRQIGF